MLFALILKRLVERYNYYNNYTRPVGIRAGYAKCLVIR